MGRERNNACWGPTRCYVVIQLLGHVQLFAPPWTVAHQASLSFTVFWSLLRLMSIELVMLSNHFLFCHPSVTFLLLPSIFPSIRVFSKDLTLRLRWPKYWRFSFSISLSNDYSGLISFRIHWFDLAVQGTFRCLLQQPNSKASILWYSGFFMVQLSHPYIIVGKTIGLTMQTFVGSNLSTF